jgi:oligopeptide transport system permease protein
MGTYFLRRLGQSIFVIWGAMTLLFLMFAVIPGNALDNLGGGSRQVDPKIVANIAKHYGLDKPLPEQYVTYWKNFAKWDLGRGTAEPNKDKPINGLLKARAANSARLAFWGLLIEVVFGIGIGVLAAIRRYTAADYVTGVISVALTGIPVFVLGLILQYLLAVKAFQWGWPNWARFPVQGIPEKWWGPIPVSSDWKKLILPSFVLASVTTGFITRLTRSSLLEVLRADYMRTATAKGISPLKVIVKHGLRNSLIPVVTVIGTDIIALFGVAVLTETVFNWPGLGSTIANSAFSEDVPVVLGLVFPVVVATTLLALAADLLYAALDPRVRVFDSGVA